MKHFLAIKNSWKLFITNKRFVALFTFLDILFFFLFFKISTALFLRASDALDVVHGLVQNAVADVQLGRSINDILLGNPEFVAGYSVIVKVMLLLIISLFVLWLVFQGLQFFLVRRLRRKTSVIKFIKSFVWINVVWLVISIVIILVLTFMARASQNPLPLFNATFISVVASLLFFVFGYVVFVSYSLPPKKRMIRKVFHLGKKWHVWLTSYVGVLLIIVIAGRLISFFASMHFLALLAYIVLIFTPLLTLLRMFMVELGKI